MNGPLLVSLLPADITSAPRGANPDHAPFIAALLLIGFLLSLILRRPGR